MELTDEEQLAQAIAMSLNEAATPAVTPAAGPPPAPAGAASSSAEHPPPTTTETTSAPSASASATITAAPETASPSTKATDSATEAPPAPQPAEEPKPAKKPPPKDTRFSLVKPAEPISVNLLDSFVQRTLLPACLQVLDQLALSSPPVPSSSSEAVAGSIPSTCPIESSSEPSAASAGASSATAVSDAALRLMGRAPDSGTGVAAGASAPTLLPPAELKQALVRVSELLITSLRRYDRQLRASAAEVATAQQSTSLSSVAPSSTTVSLASASAPQQSGEQSASTVAAVVSETAMDTSTVSVSSTAKKPEDKAEEKWLELMVLKANDVRDQLLQQLVNDLLSLLSEIRVNSSTAGFSGTGTSLSLTSN